MTAAPNPHADANKHDRVIHILRVRYSKAGKVRFTSHRDVARMWERAFRRTGLPVERTEGFTPRPRVSFGLALPTGYESVGEYLDIVVSAPPAPNELDGAGLADGRRLTAAELPELLTDALPVGIEVQAIEFRVGRTASLQELVIRCRWTFEIRDLDEAVANAAVTKLLDSTSIPTTRQHKGKQRTDDIRPAIYHLSVIDSGAYGVKFETELASKPRVVRPSELVPVLAPTHEMGVAVRIKQLIEQEGAAHEPLMCNATPAPYVQARAS